MIWARLFIYYLLISVTTGKVCAQQSVQYEVEYKTGQSTIDVTLVFSKMEANKTRLVIPRSGPGTYDLVNYLAFVDAVKGYTADGNEIAGKVGEGSFFEFGGEAPIKRISYVVDLHQMESQLLSASMSSRVRDNYVGLLGYSVFGFVEGLEQLPITLFMKAPEGWPVFSTLRPTVNRKLTSDTYQAENFAGLADAQYYFGRSADVIRIDEAPIPFFVVVYGETPFDAMEIGRRGMIALKGLQDYFGYIPMPHYTMCYEFLIPISPRHDYGFNMEHMNSMTSTGDTTSAINEYDPHPRLGTIVHHIGHSWIPLRSYGAGYRPFQWQTAPMIETIWLNEGFTWYISMYHVLGLKAIMDRFRNTVNDAPEFIKEKTLRELSQLGSTQYGLDFRIGRNLFSRGALLAHDLDMEIQRQTRGKKSFKDAALGLLKWTEANNRAFKYEEIEPIMSKATGVNLSIIWMKWQLPIKQGISVK